MVSRKKAPVCPGSDPPGCVRRDGDPHGVDILSVYKKGSAAMSYTGTDLHIPQMQ